MKNSLPPKNQLGVFSIFLVLMLLTPFVFAHGMSEADKLAIIEGGNLRFMWLGATHMLSGYDHLAFVFGIIFFLTTIKDIAKYITAFTLGHSVTLILATFNGIQLNYFLIDAVIGLSVCYVGFSNVDGFRKLLKISPPNMLVMITALGLIHGFGLSTRLQDLPLNPDDLLLNIVSFNLGIELGQISALVLMLFFINAWRKRDSFESFSLISNYGLILTGGYLFLMQMHGYEHTINASEFPTTTASTENQATNIAKGTASATITEWTDTLNIVIPARGDKEYKFYLKKNASFDYYWETPGKALFFEFHGEPEGDTSGFFQSYKKSTNHKSTGKLTAPFSGVHGWYWKNNNSEPVTITLSAKGEYDLLKLAHPAPTESPATRHESID